MCIPAATDREDARLLAETNNPSRRLFVTTSPRITRATGWLVTRVASRDATVPASFAFPTRLAAHRAFIHDTLRRLRHWRLTKRGGGMTMSAMTSSR